jgi:alpha-amylase
MRNKRIGILLSIVIMTTLFFGCGVQTIAQKQEQKQGYNGRVFYEIFVRAFNDSNKDGIGDLKGVTQKLDYLSKDLGVKGIWLMPINSSPSYHGYDVTDYYNINKDYGSIEDLKELIKEAHKRDIMVVMDMVMNHTSSQHPWFLEASNDKNNKYRDYYVWADKNTNTNETSAIGTNPWTQLGEDYYYSIFWSGMPDLNYDNKAVRDEMKKTAKFYLDMGIDGFRLDAAMHIYTDLDKNLAWWKEFNNYVKSQNSNAVLVGEVWTDTTVISSYMKSLDSCFNFPASKEIIDGINGGAVGTLASTLKNIYATYEKDNKAYIDSPFLTNHDMNRVMSTLNDSEKCKVAAAILLTLPGTPYIYYGEETGMEGTKPDESLREPFIWSNKDVSKNSNWETSLNDANKIAANVQMSDKNSIFNFYKAMIDLRNKSDALKYGTFEEVNVKDVNILAYKRVKDKKEVYVYINISKGNIKEKINFNKGTILYSNKRECGKLKLKGELEVKGGEILLMTSPEGE